MKKICCKHVSGIVIGRDAVYCAAAVEPYVSGSCGDSQARGVRALHISDTRIKRSDI
jgi:hypothetical protein